MRPLRRLSSLKLRLGIVFVAAIAVAIGGLLAVEALGLERGRAVFVAAVLALLAVQLLAHGTTAPLREMAVAAAAMARGEHGQRVTVRGSDEVARLAAAFNEMSAELEQTDRLRRDLVANVAHELRTPLSALQATLENMVDGVQPPEPRTLEAMHAQVDRLSRMVEQLLDLSRMEAGELPVQPRRFRVSELLDRVRSEMPRASDRSLAVSTSATPADLCLRADPERIGQVLVNLLGNAARFSPPGGRIEMSATGQDGVVFLAVSDEGPGIPTGERERVFERFHSVDPSRSAGGAGLGLAISRWIVELHGGTIRAEAAKPKGCRVVVELPAGSEDSRG